MPYGKGEAIDSRTFGSRGSRKNLSSPIDTKKKSIKYSATVNNLLLDLAPASDVETNTASDIVSAVKVRNDGYVPALAIFQFYRYTDATTEGAAEYLHFLLNPSEEIVLPTTRGIIAQDAEQYIGTAVVSTAPNSNEYTDSGDNVASGELNNTTDPVVFELDNGHEKYRVGDLIRCENEILRVEGTFDNNPTAETVADNHIVVSRGWHGSTSAAHSGTPDIRFPFFNAYHDYDKYSVAQTDDLGRWKSMNFFGYGRAASGEGGLTTGSIAIQFYEAGYQGLGLSDLSSNTTTGLTASTAYGFSITVDGGSQFVDLSFTTDSSNTKFGGSSGIISKIQAALDAQYYTAGNLFQKRVSVGLEGGDLVFRSGSNLSTSAIALANPTSATNIFGVGRIPAVASVKGAVAARLATETTTNPVTDGTTYKQIFIRDDGYGNLIWANRDRVGTVNYETGAIDFRMSEKPNAEFVVSLLHTSALSGKLATSTSGNNVRINSLRQVLGNTPQQKCEAVLTVETF